MGTISWGNTDTLVLRKWTSGFPSQRSILPSTEILKDSIFSNFALPSYLCCYESQITGSGFNFRIKIKPLLYKIPQICFNYAGLTHHHRLLVLYSYITLIQVLSRERIQPYIIDSFKDKTVFCHGRLESSKTYWLWSSLQVITMVNRAAPLHSPVGRNVININNN